MDIKEILKDGGYKSRKLIICCVAMLLILAGAILAEHSAAIGPIYSIYCSSILTAAALYIGGNSVVKWVLTKNLPATDNTDKTQSN